MDIAQLEQSWQVLRQDMDIQDVRSVLILGSGWSDVADAFDTLQERSYSDIPVMGGTGVAGHKGRLVLAKAGSGNILIFQGRRHWYEGMGWTPIAFPVYAAIQAGAERVLLTNAAGGVNPQFVPGDLMVITDHINAIGASPLVGNHAAIWGPRFPDLSNTYCPALRTTIHQSARKLETAIHEGVYLAAAGPTYETPAEIRMYRRFGADAIGMSTVPEAILAHAAGLSVAAISCITNHAAGVTDAPLDHAEVLEITQRVMPTMTELLHHVVTTTAQ